MSRLTDHERGLSNVPDVITRCADTDSSHGFTTDSTSFFEDWETDEPERGFAA